MHLAVSQQTPAGKIKRSKHEIFIPRHTISDTYRQVSTNCGILAPELGGIGDRERKWEERFHQKAFRKIVFSLIRLKMDPIGPKNLTRSKFSVFEPKNVFCC